MGTLEDRLKVKTRRKWKGGMYKSWYKNRGNKPNPEHLDQCPKHHVWMCWKDEAFPTTPGHLRNYGYPPVRICPVCVKLAKLTINALVAACSGRKGENLRKTA